MHHKPVTEDFCPLRTYQRCPTFGEKKSENRRLPCRRHTVNDENRNVYWRPNNFYGTLSTNFN